jgi:hypothetical protein
MLVLQPMRGYYILMIDYKVYREFIVWEFIIWEFIIASMIQRYPQYTELLVIRFYLSE